MIVKHEFGYFKTCICFRTEATGLTERLKNDIKLYLYTIHCKSIDTENSFSALA